MHVGDHRADPAHVVVLAPRTVGPREAIVDVAADRRRPVAQVGHVDGEFLGLLRHLQRRLGQQPDARGGIQGEADDALAEGQDQGGLRTVDRIAGRDLARSWLQEIAHLQLAAVVGSRQDREDGADGDVDVDVAGAVEGVEQQQVGSPGAARDRMQLLHLFGGRAGQHAAAFGGGEQHVVGQDIQLLLHLALDVLLLQGAQHAAGRALGDHGGDGLAGVGHRADQGREPGRDRRPVTLPIRQVCLERGWRHRYGLPWRRRGPGALKHSGAGTVEHPARPRRFLPKDEADKVMDRPPRSGEPPWPRPRPSPLAPMSARSLTR